MQASASHDGDLNTLEREKQSKHTSWGSRKREKKKTLTVFDEYERRGDVLEDYEDLNSERTNSNDHVLSQMVADHTERSLS